MNLLFRATHFTQIARLISVLALAGLGGCGSAALEDDDEAEAEDDSKDDRAKADAGRADAGRKDAGKPAPVADAGAKDAGRTASDDSDDDNDDDDDDALGSVDAGRNPRDGGGTTSAPTTPSDPFGGLLDGLLGGGGLPDIGSLLGDGGLPDIGSLFGDAGLPDIFGGAAP